MTARFSEEVEVKHPIIMAPMFLVSNLAMMKAGIDAGVLSTFPSLNYREDGELEGVLKELNAYREGKPGNYGINLIVQQTNPLYRKHLEMCVAHKVPVFITSLGNPKEVIEKAHSYGGKVYCDVTNIKHAQKAYSLGCDGFIAVGAGAGGHAGPNALHVLVESLNAHFPDKTIIAAGGISTGRSLAAMRVLGADAASIGTRFIATKEAGVNDEYKSAIVDSGMDDIVMTERLSGTPCAVINTPYAKKIGYKQNWFERWMNNNKTLRKYYKMIVQLRGMKRLQQSVKPGSYKTLWTAGQSVEMIDAVLTIEDVIDKLVKEMEEALPQREVVN